MKRGDGNNESHKGTDNKDKWESNKLCYKREQWRTARQCWQQINRKPRQSVPSYCCNDEIHFCVKFQGKIRISLMAHQFRIIYLVFVLTRNCISPTSSIFWPFTLKLNCGDEGKNAALWRHQSGQNDGRWSWDRLNCMLAAETSVGGIAKWL